jgi:hypothetical protein
VLARRLLLFTAILLLLATVAASLSSQRPLAEAPPSTLPATDEPVVERTISAEPGARKTITVSRGQVLRLEVKGDLLDSVLLEGLGRLDGVAPLAPARFTLLAETPGTYPIRLVEADRRLGRIRITP